MITEVIFEFYSEKTLIKEISSLGRAMKKWPVSTPAVDSSNKVLRNEVLAD